ncbi:TusE/DsrC/DsvC family sulfur relay protein [Blochmannia endosymbiont of Colobopsis nipponica]|uniref:TusE/DsrC/DsvC family sulfur relay protein n=1 Tax=Blochmannia endosymbiont of Colobopsis nipponica TaxID=2681987 RepID=UPI001780CEBA|nr:TusE/DsrC/DsvC family sulfur relay protein [Blochmannia endosymbiont of Colobopsis nipponica]QOI11041.1 TusE/DsrC/DsvC family sulfur relay protein [Blochmannia endosymbiont of Colobopsis nipponica]
MQFKQKNTTIDTYGHLININDWNEEIAIKIAEESNIYLTKKHWEIIYFLRSFYKKFKITPAMRMLVKIIALKYGTNIGNSRYLFHLFPSESPAKLAAKIAGLPKSNRCM